jgi:hypothetical protein
MFVCIYVSSASDDDYSDDNDQDDNDYHGYNVTFDSCSLC